MAQWRTIGFSAVLLGMSGLAAALPGCGSGGGGAPSGPGVETKIEPPVNAPAGSGSVQEEYKNLSPAGKAR
jgi:hypothetical protein